jgi:hypothetical protein
MLRASGKTDAGPSSTRLRFLALALGALATVLAALYARGVSLDSGVFGFLPEDVPSVTAWRDSLRRFDLEGTWLVGLDEPGPGLSIDGLRHLDAVTRSLDALKADGVLAVRSVTNVQTLREGEGGVVESGPLMPALPTDATTLNALTRAIANNPAVLGALVSRDLRGYAVVVRADPRKDAVALAAIVERTVDTQRGPLEARYLGAPFFARVPMKHVVAGLPWIAPTSLFCLFGLFWLGLRRPGRVLLVLGAAGASLVFGLALMRAFGQSVSPSSATLALGWFAVAGATFARLAERSSVKPARPWPSAARATVSVALVAAGAFCAARARVLCTPQELFSAKHEVGGWMAFFDERFGGSDFIQVDIEGDLTSPSVAARVLRLSDLLEGSPGLSDVRSVAQVLAFVNHGFGDAYRVPSSREALANLWFFLEGNGDVRNLVSSKRDEALVQIRIPSHPAEDIGADVAAIESAVAASAGQDGSVTARRLDTIARTSGVVLDPARLADTIAAATRTPTPVEETEILSEVTSRLRQILQSPDSPYRPSDQEWPTLATALEDGPRGLRDRLAAVTASMKRLHAEGVDAAFIDMLVERERGVRLAVRSEKLLTRLLPVTSSVTSKGPGLPGTIADWATAPAGLRDRAEGAITDLIDPETDPGQATMTVRGLPVVAGAIAASSLSKTWRALASVFALGVVVIPFLGIPATVRRFLIAAAATGLTFLAARAAGMELDVGSKGVYVLPAILGLFTSTSTPATRSFLLALGAAMLPLCFTGAEPVTRLAAAAAASFASVASLGWFLSAEAQ